MQKKVELLKTDVQDCRRKLANEKSLRVKIEADYMENAAQHEDEVRLRMEFERKLNETLGYLRESRTLGDSTQKLLDAAAI